APHKLPTSARVPTPKMLPATEVSLSLPTPSLHRAPSPEPAPLPLSRPPTPALNHHLLPSAPAPGDTSTKSSTSIKSSEPPQNVVAIPASTWWLPPLLHPPPV
ncbi:hypothetical protein PTTG_11210, partial [Puccinia triticina 1-1 BBBD Race 1]|uniref:Uncharacterized protein n=1 Tax=Puccinia triticina (isolate 1-1 / race 1 (BBBD)) TaxID=630390 RepID=A0A0C4FDA5_PUCT1